VRLFRDSSRGVVTCFASSITSFVGTTVEPMDRALEAEFVPMRDRMIDGATRVERAGAATGPAADGTLAVMPDAPAEADNDLVILAPVYNDWPAVRLLLARLDAELARHRLRARVVLVNDGSFLPAPSSLVDGELSAVSQLRILTLRRNLGHQRALAIGLAFVHARMPCAAVVVMDADGEDDSADVPRLVAEMRGGGETAIVFAHAVVQPAHDERVVRQFVGLEKNPADASSAASRSSPLAPFGGFSRFRGVAVPIA
jgi:hypothetical protein